MRVMINIDVNMLARYLSIFIVGNSVSNKQDFLDNIDNAEYNLLPMFII